jgi:hypothetical protein
VQLTDNKIQWCITNNDPDFEMRIIQWAPLVYFKEKNCDPYQPWLPCTHLVSWTPTSSRHWLNVTYHHSISLGPA